MTQTYIQINRVVHRGTGSDDDADDLCSLIVADDGLYVIRTGNSGALVDEQEANSLNQVVAVGSTQDFVREVAENEARLQREPLATLAKTPGSTFLPLSDVTMVHQTGSLDVAMLTLMTKAGKFTFAFPQTRVEDVVSLKKAITQG